MKKTFRLLVTLLLMLCMITTLLLAANAADVVMQDGLEVSISTDKDAYAEGTEIVISVSIKNNNPYDFEGLSVKTIIPSGLKIKGGETALENVTIPAGETYETKITAIKEKTSNNSLPDWLKPGISNPNFLDPSFYNNGLVNPNVVKPGVINPNINRPWLTLPSVSAGNDSYNETTAPETTAPDTGDSDNDLSSEGNEGGNSSVDNTPTEDNKDQDTTQNGNVSSGINDVNNADKQSPETNVAENGGSNTVDTTAPESESEKLDTPDTSANSDDKKDTPQTGDSFNIVICVVLLLASAAGIVLAVKYKKASRVLSLFLCCAIVLGVAPVSALAAEDEIITVTVDKTIKVASKNYIIKVAISYPASSAPCIVSFDSVGGNAVESKFVTRGSTLSDVPYPEKDGFAFVGWYIDAEYSETFDFSEAINESCTLYARWVDITDTTDTDGDGLTDPVENYYETNISAADTDSDGLNDYVEVAILGYNPLKADSDDNGVIDSEEDFDNDGIINKDEIELGTDPSLADSDGDALNDLDEINTYKTNPVISDTDGDGASDGKEIELGTDPLNADESFELSVSAGDKDDSVKPSVEITLSGEQVESLHIDSVNDDNLFPESMPGYMGKAYDFNVDGEFSSAVISFEFDASALGENADPVIYYFNEVEQELEALETTINGNVASATVTHFSKYILIDRTVYEESFTWVDVWESEAVYTDIEIVFVVDDSGSMDWNDPYNERLTVSRTLIDNLPDNSKIGLIRFNGSYPTALTSSLTANKDTVKGYLTSNYFRSSGGTDMYNGIQKAFPLYESTESTTLKLMIVLSDGETDDTYLHSSVINTANENNIRIYTVGLGSSSSYFNRYLKPLASNTNATFYYASNATQLADIYKNISEKIEMDTDSDEDGIPDYYEEHMPMFNGVPMNLDKYSKDSDGDGLEDGEEVELKFEYNADKTKVKVTGKLVKGNPALYDTDNDGWSDFEDPVPLKFGLEDGIVGALMIVSAYSGQGTGHSYLAYTSYVNDSIVVSGTIVDLTLNTFPSMNSEELCLIRDQVITIGAFSSGNYFGSASGSDDGSSTGKTPGGIYINYEQYKEKTNSKLYTPRKAIWKYITKSQLDDLSDFILVNNYYSLRAHNCSTVASQGWNKVIGDTLSARGSWFEALADTPKVLKENIESRDGVLTDAEYYVEYKK